MKSTGSILNLIHVEDVNHKISGFIKSVYEKDPVFESCTKHLSGLRGKLSLSKVPARGHEHDQAYATWTSLPNKTKS
uniref:hypothetical protein n=1 Tax=Mariniflexile sp. TaxID=1979402 RepID=UPI004048637F